MYSLYELASFYIIGILVGVISMFVYEDRQEKQAFRRYEQQRRAYSASRLRRIERGEF